MCFTAFENTKNENIRTTDDDHEDQNKLTNSIRHAQCQQCKNKQMRRHKEEDNGGS